MALHSILVMLFVPQFALATYKSRYQESAIRDTQLAQSVGIRIQSLDPSLCTKSQVAPHSACFREYLKRTAVRSTPHLGGLTRVATAAALLDVKSGANKNLELLDNEITLFEQVHPEGFYLRQNVPTDELELQDHAELCASDEKMLFKFRQEISADIERMLGSHSRGGPRADQLKERWAKLKNATWTYQEVKSAPVEISRSADPFPAPNIKTASTTWCTEPSVMKCFKVDPTKCRAQFNVSLSQCEGNNDCAVGKWIRTVQMDGLMRVNPQCKDFFLAFISK